MQNMTDYCDKIKTSELIAHIGALDISATAKYIATVMHTIAVVDVGELARITGLERRTIQRAKADYAAASGNDNRDTRDNGVKNDATIATIASNLTFPDDNCVKFDVLPPIAPTCADIASRATKESSSKILLVKEEASKLAAPDLSEEMISNIAKWANMPTANSAQWLASTIATFGQSATVESYHKMMSDKLQGAIVAKPIATWAKIAKRMKDEAAAGVKTGSERIAPWKQEKIDGTREALKIAAEMGYA